MYSQPNYGAHDDDMDDQLVGGVPDAVRVVGSPAGSCPNDSNKVDTNLTVGNQDANPQVGGDQAAFSQVYVSRVIGVRDASGRIRVQPAAVKQAATSRVAKGRV
ncbi:unnamed protein product, partial [Rotaria sp. Silwood2]